MLTFSRFAELNKERSQSSNGFRHLLSDWSLAEWIVAALGELGEAANVAKKLNRVRDGIPGNKETEAELRVQFQEEIADTVIYLDLLAQSQGFTLEDAIRNKWNKTAQKIGFPGEL